METNYMPSLRRSVRTKKITEKGQALQQEKNREIWNKLLKSSKKSKNLSKKEKAYFSKLAEGISRKRSRKLSKLSGLKKNTAKNTSLYGKSLQRIKRARNQITKKHRLGTIKKENKENNLNSLVKALSKLKMGGGKTRRKCY